MQLMKRKVFYISLHHLIIRLKGSFTGLNLTDQGNRICLHPKIMDIMNTIFLLMQNGLFIHGLILKHLKQLSLINLPKHKSVSDTF